MEHDLNIKLYVNIITVKSNGFVSTELVQVIIIFIRQIGVKQSHHNCNGKNNWGTKQSYRKRVFINNWCKIYVKSRKLNLLDPFIKNSLSIAQKMMFSMKDFFSKCDQIRSFRWIWSHLLNKSLMENFISCVVFCQQRRRNETNVQFKFNVIRYPVGIAEKQLDALN